jgi:hypothetical protein
MKKDKNLDELFRDKLLNYEQEPPAYLLDNILSGVAGARRRRKLIYWRVAGVAAALLLAFVAGWQLNNRDGLEMNSAVIVSKSSAPEVQSETKTQVEKEMPTNETSQSMSQLAAVESNPQIRNNQSKSIARSSKSETIAMAGESVQVATNSEFLVLKPLKSLYLQIYSDNENSNSLQAKKASDSSSDITEKSIDQQIMEQNKQMLAVESKSKEKVRWLVGAQVSPEYSNSRGSQSQVYASNMLNASSNSVDLGGGISVEYKKGKRWSLQSGVYYSGLGQSSGNSSNSSGKNNLDASLGSNYFNTVVNMDASSNRMSLNSNAGVIELNKIPSGMVLGTSLEDKTLASSVIVSPTNFIQNFQYIEIPLYLRYTLIDARFDVVMLGGFSSNVLVGNQIFVEDNSGRSLVGKTKDMEALNYSGTLGMGFKYGLSKRIFLNVEPRMKYYLNSLNSNSSVTYKPYTFGVFTGLSYEF